MEDGERLELHAGVRNLIDELLEGTLEIII